MTANAAFAEGDLTVATDSDSTPANATLQSSAGSTALSYGIGYQNFEASQAIPYLPGTPGVTANAPTLFSLQGFPTQVGGLPILSKNLVYASHHDVALGISGGTKIIFNGSFPAPRPAKKDRNVYINLSGIGRGEVIGSITIQSRKDKADEVDLSTLLFDARQYVAGIRELKGYNVTLLTIRNTITYSLGVDGKASGITLAPLASGLINGASGVMAGLASGYSSNGGVTTTTALVGCTFLVLVDSEQNGVVDLTSSYNVPEQSHENGNGNNKKKYEAIQKDDAE